MENAVPRKQRLLPEFSVNISSTIISGEMTRRTETEHKKGRERLVDQSERTMGRTKGIKEQKDPIKGGPPPPLRCPNESAADRVEDSVPYVRLEIGPVVFIKAFTRTAIVAFDFDGFPNAHIIA